MQITVKSRSKSIQGGEFEAQTLAQLSGAIAKASRLNSNRLRLTSLLKKPITTDDELRDNEHAGENIVLAKDLGPQISWRLVFIIEYFGPILIHYLGYQWAQKPAELRAFYYMNLAHYLKREFETLFVHTFSNSTMPLFNLFKNSFHYWVLGGSIILNYFGIGDLPLLDAALNLNKTYVIYFWLFCETFNFITHVQLRLLGDKTIKLGKKRVEPSGGFFELFISPNYTFEILGWLAVFLLHPNVFTFIFWAVGAVQMYFWSKKKARKFNSTKSFLIPFVL